MLHAIDVVLSAQSLWVDVVVTVVYLLTCVRVCVCCTKVVKLWSHSFLNLDHLTII